MEFHKEHLLKCCRVCGRRLKKSKGVGRTFGCSSNSKLLLETFLLDVTQDYSDTHPPEYCFSCQGVIRRKVAADKKGLPYHTSATHNLYEWSTHMEGECKVKPFSLNTLNTMLVINTGLWSLQKYSGRWWAKLQEGNNLGQTQRRNTINGYHPDARHCPPPPFIFFWHPAPSRIQLFIRHHTR